MTGVQTCALPISRLRARTPGKLILMAGILGEFRARALMPVLARHADVIHLLRPSPPRACDFPVLEAFLSDFSGPVHCAHLPDLFPEPGVCALGRPEDALVATGSIYLMGEILERLRHERLPGEHRLQDLVPTP